MSDPIKITDIFQMSALDNSESGDFYAICLNVPAATDAQHREIAQRGADLISFTREVIKPPKEMVFGLVLEFIQEILNPQTEPERIYAFLIAATTWRSIMHVVEPEGGFGSPLSPLTGATASAMFTPVKLIIPDGADQETIQKIVRKTFEQIAEEHRRQVTNDENGSAKESAVSNDNTEAGR